MVSEANRFWPKVDKSGGPDSCWPWMAAKTQHGYGYFGSVRPDGKWRSVNAHRIAWELAHGPIPTGEGFHGTCVLHRCDNPACVNPAHLFLGSNSDNVRDMFKKGRAGMQNGTRPTAKLTADAVDHIKVLLSTGVVRQDKIAAAFGVSPPTISNIKYGRAWAEGRKPP